MRDDDAIDAHWEKERLNEKNRMAAIQVWENKPEDTIKDESKTNMNAVAPWLNTSLDILNNKKIEINKEMKLYIEDLAVADLRREDINSNIAELKAKIFEIDLAEKKLKE